MCLGALRLCPLFRAAVCSADPWAPPERLARYTGSPVRPLAWILTLALASCRAPLETVVLESPGSMPAFPAHSGDERLWIEADFVANQEDVFGLDLVAYHILPVAVRVGTRPGAAFVRLEEESFAPRLILEDGTTLERVRVEDTGIRLARVLDRMRALELPLAPLPAWEEARARFLFFRIEKPVRVRGAYALSRGGEVWRELELADSLLVFQTRDDQGEHTIQVGLRVAHWPGSRAPTP